MTFGFLRNIFSDYVDDFRAVIRPVVLNSRVQSMRDFQQHGDTCCFNHCLRVAKHTYSICRLLGLDSDSGARGAMLHDFCLYDWQEEGMGGVTHLIMHPLIALDEAAKSFDLNEKERDIIRSHMWPLSVTLPRHPETYVVLMVDKYIAVKESMMFMGQAFRRHTVIVTRAIFRGENESQAS